MNNREEKRSQSTNINWYPGHMFKTKKELKEDISVTDLVIEVLDARAPIASRNPDILSITENKKRIIVLNKEDLADEEENIKWQKHLSQEAETILLNSEKETGFKNVLKLIDKIMADKLKKDKEKGIKHPVIRLMIVGIPNSGKSSFINRIAKRKTMEVGNSPGVTKKKQWIRIDNNKEILDTPGILWPKFTNKEIALNLAIIGSIKDDIVDFENMALKLLEYMIVYYPDRLSKIYNIEEEVNTLREEYLETLGKKSENAIKSFDLIAITKRILKLGSKLDKTKLYKLYLAIGESKNVYKKRRNYR